MKTAKKVNFDGAQWVDAEWSEPKICAVCEAGYHERCRGKECPCKHY